MKRAFRISITWARRRSLFNFRALPFSSSDLKISAEGFIVLLEHQHSEGPTIKFMLEMYLS
jgi:hypothetical protein